ncbi:MAG TPA: hypothetical protein VMZ29_16380 [Candidatus Bathyarchaeia archaeon]|nr:hypothetical protein [Candidatus Bathyarchaeia archaeon]
MISFVQVNADENPVIDFLIYNNPDVQVIVDEIIASAEDVGLTVNPIYIDDWNYYLYLVIYTTNWDMYYGGTLGNNIPDTIFQLAYGNMGLHYYYLKHDDAKYAKFSLQLYQWFLQAQADPSVVDDDYINDMIDKFHDAEERLWEKQLIITLAEFVNPIGDVRNDVLMPNCLPGHAFADKGLRLAFSHAIDRTIIVNTRIGQGFTDVNILYQLYSCSMYHDTTLPNNLPT